jgi:drug/metabolite transporter (DMT)-like permease
VVPATAANYIVGTLGAKFLLKERVSKARWAGMLLVAAGVTLVCTAH